MSKGAWEPLRLEDSIIADEIGLESGGYGIYRLRSLYQPIYERRGRSLHMVAVEGTVAPYVAGEIVPPEMFDSAVTDEDDSFVGRMGVALVLRNHVNIDAQGLDLFLTVGSGDSDDEMLADRVPFIVGELGNAEIEPGSIFCAIGSSAVSDAFELSLTARQMRDHGLRIAVGDFGAGHWSDEQLNALEPDIVRIDGDWFQKVCRDATTVRLFDSVVARLRDRHSRVLVSGISTEMQFGVAVRAGAHLFQGDHLARPALAGTIMDEEPVSIAQRLGNARKIVPLFG